MQDNENKENEQKEVVVSGKDGVTDIKLRETIQLLFPIKVDGAEIKEVTMRRGKVSDHRNANITSGGNQADYELHLFSALCGLPVETIDEMDYADYQTLQKVYSGFLSS